MWYMWALSYNLKVCTCRSLKHCLKHVETSVSFIKLTSEHINMFWEIFKNRENICLLLDSIYLNLTGKKRHKITSASSKKQEENMISENYQYQQPYSLNKHEITHFLGVASTVSSLTGTKWGMRNVLMERRSRCAPYSSYRLKPSSLYRRSDTFHNFIVLSEKTIFIMICCTYRCK